MGDGDGDVMGGRREGGGLAARLFLGVGCGSWGEDGSVWRFLFFRRREYCYSNIEGVQRY